MIEKLSFWEFISTAATVLTFIVSAFAAWLTNKFAALNTDHKDFKSDADTRFRALEREYFETQSHALKTFLTIERYNADQAAREKREATNHAEIIAEIRALRDDLKGKADK